MKAKTREQLSEELALAKIEISKHKQTHVTNEAMLNQFIVATDELRRQLEASQGLVHKLQAQLKYVTGCQEAQSKGADDFNRGISLKDNPYDRREGGTAERFGVAWEVGWKLQEYDKKLATERTIAIKALTSLMVAVRLELRKNNFKEEEAKAKKETALKEAEEVVRRFNTYGIS